MNRYVLSDSQWAVIEGFLPGRVGHVGATCHANRLFLESILWIMRTGAPWRDLPKRFGPWKTAYNRFNRWGKAGVWEKIFKALCQDPDFEYVMVDSTIVRAHQHSAGAKGGKTIKHWAVVEVAFPQKFMRLWMPSETPSSFA